MKLKKLSILGFKSFADRLVLSIDQNLTAIVGPNGCGKSNIADAIRWVLGETSAKSMRGGKMAELIFAGNHRRKPSNIAEVSITFSDVRGSLAVEYEEVEVTRRLYRDGDSEYLINGNTVRLKDIQALFWDSGLGKNAFSIFEQGKVEQVIHLNPTDRNNIFKEAAGIFGAEQRRREAQKKLQQAGDNLQRVGDIHKEVLERKDLLQRQAEEAKEFKRNRDELEHLEKAVLVAKIKKLRQESQEGAAQSEGLSKDIANKEGSLSRQKIALEAAQDQIRSKQEALKNAQQAFFQKQREKDVRETELKALKKRTEEAAQRKASLELRLKDLKRKSEELLLEDKRLKACLKESQKKLSFNKQEAEKEEGLREKAEEGLQAFRKELEVLQKKRIQAIQEHNQASTELKQTEVRLENLAQREKSLKASSEKVCNSLKINEVELKKRQDQGKELEKESKQTQEELQKTAEKNKLIQKELSTQERQLEKGRRELTEKKARLASLERLREDMEGFSKHSKTLLKESQKGKGELKGLLRPLYELVQALPEQEKLAAQVLRKYSQTLAVANKTDLETVLNFAKSKNLKEFSLICLDSLGSKTAKGVEKILQADPSLKGFLPNLRLERDLWEAIDLLKNSGEECCISGGFSIDSQGVIFFQTEGESNSFLREAELKRLSKEVEELEKAVKALQKTLEKSQGELKRLEEKRQSLDQSLRKIEMKQVEQRIALKGADQEIKRLQKESTNLERELKDIGTHQEKLQKSKEALKETVTAFEKNLQGEGSLVNELEAKISQESQELKKLREKCQKLSQEVNALQQTVHQSQKTLGVGEARLEEGKKQMLQIEKELKEVQEVQSKELPSQEDLVKGVEAVGIALEEQRKLLKYQETQFHDHQRKVQALSKELNKEESSLRRMQDEHYRLQVSQKHQGSSLDELGREFFERFGRELEDGIPQNFELKQSLEAAGKRLKVLRKAVEKTDNINMASIEEYDKYRVRYDFLNQQLEDLSESKNELLKLVRNLDQTCKKKFTSTFTKIRSNFQKNFSLLFEGGEADLRISDPQDPLEAGIEIVAKPPGKQMRSISLLSGGEKCLTAMALLFAVFEHRPAPLCILDEIDAPLDDSNIARFVRMVQEFTDQTQFLIVTHNKRTMAIADTLFGVSMEEKGVSKLLTLKFNPNNSEKEVHALAN